MDLVDEEMLGGEMQRDFDVVIIGAGITGAMVARFLSRYEIRILIIEKEPFVCQGASGANSATIHTGHSALPGTLKAELNVKGHGMWDELSAQLRIPYRKTGDYVVAVGDDERSFLDELVAQAKANGVREVSIVSGEEMRQREPAMNPAVSGAFWARDTGLCDPWLATVAALDNARQNGATLKTSTRFLGFLSSEQTIVGVDTNRGRFSCRWVINAAGAHADEVMHAAGVHPEFRITPRRGEYLLVDGKRLPVKGLLSPVPSKTTKGIAVKAMIDGNVLVGSNAEEIQDKEDTSVTPDGLGEVWRGAQKLIPGMNPDHVLGVAAGLRATGNAPCLTDGVCYNADFLVEIADEVDGLVNLAGIESPGLTAAPAIALRVIEMLRDAGETLKEQRAWNPVRPSSANGGSVVERNARELRARLFSDVPSWCCLPVAKE